MTEKKLKYRIHPDSIGNYKDLEIILQEIENYVTRLAITKIPRENALMELLTVHSELALLPSQGMINNSIEISPALDSRQNENLIQESLKWCVKWIFDFCKDKKIKVKTRPTRKELIDTLIFAFKYDILRNTMFPALKDEDYVKVGKNKIEIISENDNHHAYIAYNSWRQAYRERLQINNIQSKGINVLKEIQIKEFIMPEFWNLGTYTLQEYKRFNVSLDELLIKWIKNHLERNPKITIEEYPFKKLIKVFHKKWWVNQISQLSGLSEETVDSIIGDLTYSNTKNNDPAYQFFIPLSKEKLALSICFTSMYVRPERNLIALLPKLEDKAFNKLSNDCEAQQIKMIRQLLNNKNIIIGEKKTKAQEKRPGMDILFLNIETLDLLFVELKWRIPPSSTSEMYAVDEHVEKGLRSLLIAQQYINQNIDTILSEYFGPQYKKIRPTRFEGCVVINENIGTGRRCDKFAPVITLDHLIELLNNKRECIIDVLINKKHRIPSEFYSKIPIRFKLLENEILTSGTKLQASWLDKSLPSYKGI